MTGQHEQLFFPAGSFSEAISRIYSLTGAAAARGRGEKRALLALRDALGLEVETGATGDRMGRAIADQLGIAWDPLVHCSRHTLTLAGINALLEGASYAYQHGSLRQLRQFHPPALSAPDWQSFQSARSKIEAVNRLSTLAGAGAEFLGPGGKEHKRVLEKIVIGLNLPVSVTTKHGTAAALAREFRVPWPDSAISTQGTITLEGLNLLLAGAERRVGALGRSRSVVFGTPEQEGAALAGALRDGWRATRQPDGRRRVVWDGRDCVTWMKEEGISKGPNENEWQGFYFEHKGISILNAAFTANPSPPQSRYVNTTFDYALNFVWDLKSHAEFQWFPSVDRIVKGGSGAPLNAQEAMRQCITSQGLGFLILSGRAVMDEDWKFYDWHRAFKGRPPKPSNSGRSTMRKAGFEPQHVEAFWFPTESSLDAARAAGTVRDFNQGRQASGDFRNPKFQINISKARDSDLIVGRSHWVEEEV